MDLREIQNLHARYASTPVTIDIAGQIAALPAPLAPESDESLKRSTGPHLKTIAAHPRMRYALIGVAVAALAAATGMSAGKVWQATHPATVKTVSSVHERAPAVSPPAPGAAQPPEAKTEAPTAGEVHALTASDFERDNHAASGMAAPDPAVLQHRAEERLAPRAQQATSAADSDRALASPIHAPHAAAPSQTTAAPQPASIIPVRIEPPAVPTLRSPIAAAASAVPVSSAKGVSAAAAATIASSPDGASSLRHIHHITSHRAAAVVQERAASAVTPATPATAPARGNDVQLF